MHKMENIVHEKKGTLMGENRNSKYYCVCMVRLEFKTSKK